ncbi:MAG: efflux RND transporter periplasmic adaptor subunit [Pseudomonadota bacterium]
MTSANPRNKLKVSLTALAFGTMLATGLVYMTHAADTSEATEGSVAAAPVPVVQTMTVEEASLRTWNTFSGRLTAVEEASIRPLVSGTIQQVLFEDGAYVEAGQELFVIDPRPFAAELQAAEASLQSARSDSALAKTEFERAEVLASNNSISRSVRDNRENDLKIAQARELSAAAQVTSAKLNLDYAHVKAPISGRIGRAEVTVGNVVESGSSAPVLTTVVATDQLYAEFDVDESTYFSVQRSAGNTDDHAVSTEATSALYSIPVEIVLGANGDAVYQAQLHSFDNQLDIASGTIRARAVLDNSHGNLIPGVFASVRLGTAVEEPTLLVPSRAVGVSQDKRFVYVVNNDSRVEYREVSLGRAIDSRRVVTSGVSEGERVIVNGIQRVGTDMQVEAIPVTAEQAVAGNEVASAQ